MRGRVVGGLALAGALVTALLPVSSPAMTYTVRTIDAPGLAELRRLHQAASRAPEPERERRWFDVAAFALHHARSTSWPPGEDAPEVAAALRDATARLPASSLAALAAITPHPTLSEEYCRAVVRDGGPTRISGTAEAAAEARDGIAAFGSTRGKALVDVLKRGNAAARGAGGTQNSVYRIVVVAGSVADSASRSGRVHLGIRAGIDASAGAWAPRFRVSSELAGEDELAAALPVQRAIERAGVLVVTGSAGAWSAAAAAGLSRGLVVVDARAPGDVGPSAELWFDPGYADLEAELKNGAGMIRFSGELGYLGVHFSGEELPPVAEMDFRTFQLRPTALERARRLAEAAAARPEARRVAIAIPREGGDRLFAAAFLGAMRVLGRETMILVYEPGRRDYAAEARRFIATGAQALLLAGPAEESAEWLAALGKARSKPLVLGTSELDPAGFHVPVRGLLEGAIYIGDDWEDRNPAAVPRAGVDEEFAADPDFRRGYRFGWTVGRAAVEGAYTATSLRVTLEDKSLPRPMAQFSRAITGVERDAGAVPIELEVPLYEIKGGQAQPLVLPVR